MLWSCFSCFDNTDFVLQQYVFPTNSFGITLIRVWSFRSRSLLQHVSGFYSWSQHYALGSQVGFILALSFIQAWSFIQASIFISVWSCIKAWTFLSRFFSYAATCVTWHSNVSRPHILLLYYALSFHKWFFSLVRQASPLLGLACAACGRQNCLLF